MTILEAIQQVLKEGNRPLTSEEIYEDIKHKKLYSFGAKNPKGVAQGIIRRHCSGIDFPTAHPVKYFKIDSKKGAITKYVLMESGIHDMHISKEVTGVEVEDFLPEEKMQHAYNAHKESIREALLEKIMESDPAFFEQLVVDLLLKMGYGGNDPNSGSVTRRTHDGGIDGKINEDKLGLDKIYIQAKRYGMKNKVGRPEIIGAMENTLKGVFITTSSFAKGAIECAEKSQKNIVLINGEKLTELMIGYKVGINVAQIFEAYKIDIDYFV